MLPALVTPGASISFLAVACGLDGLLDHAALRDEALNFIAGREIHALGHEATRYRGVGAERLQEVADALKLRVHEVFTLERE